MPAGRVIPGILSGGIGLFVFLSCDGIQNDPLFLKWKNEKAGLLAVPDSIYFSIAAGPTKPGRCQILRWSPFPVHG